MQQEVYRIMREGVDERRIYPHTYFDVLQQLVGVLCSQRKLCMPLQHALDEALAHQIPPIKDKRNLYKPSFEFLDASSRQTVLQQAYWLLTGWPNRFVDFMKTHRISRTPLLQDFQHPPFWYQSIIMANLYVNNVNRRFADFWK
jgi:hypothetical protein